MKAVRRFKRKVRVLAAQKRRLVQELRAARARGRKLPPPTHAEAAST